MIPVIGILPVIEDGKSFVLQSYVTAIERSGGLPVMLPYTQSAEAIAGFASLCDGFLYAGGVDVEPRRYGEEPLAACGAVSPLRDAIDFLAFRPLFQTKKPILGICRGAQVLNVALGGTLYQDIPSRIDTDLIHRQDEPYFSPSHEVSIKQGTPLAELLGRERIAVNSLHHQSIKAAGKGIEVMAIADDGVIEAAYLPSHPYFRLIQWHPERSYEVDGNSRRIFDEFVEACEKK